VFDVTPSPGVVNQNVAHYLGGHGEKVRAILPLNILRTRHSNIGLIDQRRSLQRVAIALALHVTMGNAPYLVVHQRRQPIERGSVSVPPFD
jgi:hypothetical protein